MTSELNTDAPHNIEAEQALLGALLLDNNLLQDVNDELKKDHFSHQVHGAIFEAICYLVDLGRVADPITLKEYFHRNQALEPVGGSQYLIDLAAAILSTSSVSDYSRIIYDGYLRRQLIHIGQKIVVQARQPSLDMDGMNQIELAEKELYDLANEGNRLSTVASFKSALSYYIKNVETAFKKDSHIIGVTTGFVDLDRYLGGLHPSDLLILAGRPSMGKTALATNIAFNAAKANLENPQEGAKVLFFSLEMSADQLAGRILSSETQIPSDAMRRGDVRLEDFDTLLETASQTSELPLFIECSGGITLQALRNRSRRLQRQYNIGLIVIDYLQLIDGGSNKFAGNRTQEISEISRGLKNLAKELNVPVLALSQLSRAVEQREDKRPQLSDLRESGSIEQDADVVMFVYREEYYEERRQPGEGTEKHGEWQKKMAELHNKAEVIVAKQRHGPLATVKLFFDGRFTRFGNLAEGERWKQKG